MSRIAALFLRALLRAYQLFLSPLVGPTCRFVPSCSEFTREAIERHGPGRGSWLGARRLCRCHPWNPGGLDPVPEPSLTEPRWTDPAQRRTRIADSGSCF